MMMATLTTTTIQRQLAQALQRAGRRQTRRQARRNVNPFKHNQAAVYGAARALYRQAAHQDELITEVELSQ